MNSDDVCSYKPTVNPDESDWWSLNACCLLLGVQRFLLFSLYIWDWVTFGTAIVHFLCSAFGLYYFSLELQFVLACELIYHSDGGAAREEQRKNRLVLNHFTTQVFSHLLLLFYPQRKEEVLHHIKQWLWINTRQHDWGSKNFIRYLLTQNKPWIFSLSVYFSVTVRYHYVSTYPFIKH